MTPNKTFNPTSRLTRMLAAATLGAAALAATGCASSPPTFAEQMRSQSATNVKLAEQWEAGRADLKAGEKLVASGEKQIRNGRKMVSRGEAMVKTGRLAVDNNKSAYATLSAQPAPTDTPEAAARHAKELATLTSAWKAGEAKVAEGQQLITRGQRMIGAGEADLRRGQPLVERGKTAMARAEAKAG